MEFGSAFRHYSLAGLVIAGITTAKFYKLLDDKRTDMLPLEKQGPKPTVKMTKGERAKNNLSDFLERWNKLNQPSGVSPGSHAPTTGANAHRLFGRSTNNRG